MTRSVTTHDAEWTPWDRQVALAIGEERALLCGDCGQPRDETMADEKLGPVPDYRADGYMCRACQAREVKAAEMARREAPELAGVKFAVSRNGTS